ncbi:hypothetical protein EDD58_101626 [Hazenella coriacea]|uniref:Uncharacterized protein n=1 Tax=Hazenella coriacea TaxID=1179467 RepID=A0A4R3LB38_9BACL|nr:hypothetical protein EDD58_101626 [Hazenella coriacea]
MMNNVAIGIFHATLLSLPMWGIVTYTIHLMIS